MDPAMAMAHDTLEKIRSSGGKAGFGGGEARSGERRRHMDGLGGPIHLFFFFSFFIFINRGRQLVRLGKSMIYYDLLFEADRLPASETLFAHLG
jgi:hypothetical protein